MEDFHKRSIYQSRKLAASNAWRKSDGDSAAPRPVAHTDDWDPVQMPQPTQPEWDAASLRSYNDGPHTPGSPAAWSQDNLGTPNEFGGGNRGYFDGNTRGSVASTSGGEGFNNFLERANKTIGREQRHVPDPFLEGGLAPNRPFGAHSRISSVESISTIVDEKSNSPLNKAIASVSIFIDHMMTCGG
jgi:alpha-1,3-glucan synthase